MDTSPACRATDLHHVQRRTEKSPEKFVAPLQGIYARMQKQAG
jgi:hypothetical protein